MSNRALHAACRGLLLTASVTLLAAPQTDQQAAAPAQVLTPVAGTTRARLAGVWDYNNRVSVDAATGRPEQAPASATQQPPGTGGFSGSRAGASGGTTEDFDRAVLAMMVAERRAIVRDLLEVAEKLTIRVTAGAVTVKDDLGRERTYPTDGKTRKYQLGAAQFEARATWDGVKFRKEIEAANDFKMTEEYFASADDTHLFLIIRLGDPRKPEAQAGLNRVYDRVSR